MDVIFHFLLEFSTLSHNIFGIKSFFIQSVQPFSYIPLSTKYHRKPMYATCTRIAVPLMLPQAALWEDSSDKTLSAQPHESPGRSSISLYPDMPISELL